MEEAQDICIYLMPLRCLFEELENMELPGVKGQIKAFMHTVCLVWANSRRYNTPGRLIVLLQETCNLLIQQVGSDSLIVDLFIYFYNTGFWVKFCASHWKRIWFGAIFFLASSSSWDLPLFHRKCILRFLFFVFVVVVVFLFLQIITASEIVSEEGPVSHQAKTGVGGGIKKLSRPRAELSCRLIYLLWKRSTKVWV